MNRIDTTPRARRELVAQIHAYEIGHVITSDVPQPERIAMWEILVPTVRRIGGKPYTTRYHRVWDAKIRELTGGLTVMTPAKGQWVSPDGELFAERMIPVRIIGTRTAIEQIIDHTLEYYDQLAVLCYRVSEEVIIKHRCA